MIIFFGPAGSGKSVQGQMLAARQGWRWLSMGQLLRDTHDEELFKVMQEGGLVPDEKANEIIGESLKNVSDIKRVILDGYPRKLKQAEWLVENQPLHSKSIDMVVVLEVPRAEIIKRLGLRGRPDDTPKTIGERLMIYRKEIYPILHYLSEQGVHVAHIDGTGTVGQIHDRIIEEVNSCKLL